MDEGSGIPSVSFGGGIGGPASAPCTAEGTNDGTGENPDGAAYLSAGYETGGTVADEVYVTVWAAGAWYCGAAADGAEYVTEAA